MQLLSCLVDLCLKEKQKVQTELFEQQEDRSFVWSISGITQAIRKSLETEFPVVWVRGEISNLRVQSSGHRYFLLKDQSSQLKAVLFRGDASNSSYLPEEGEGCLVFGEITVYEPRGEYQLRVKHLLPDGMGNLRSQFEKLKEKLLKEGLFDEERKKTLPTFAQKIALVTSQDGAALQDFISILKRRNWTGKIYLIPSLVQGEDAPSQLVNGVLEASKISGIDLLILTRGGGSMEDLWSFNDELLVRRLAQCQIPTMSAIGHQTDFVLSDFVADFRAETPSAAAEWISSQYLDKINQLNQLEQNLHWASFDLLTRNSDRLKLLQTTLERLSPHNRMDRHHQQLDELEHRLLIFTLNHFERIGNKLEYLSQRLHTNSLPAALKRGFSFLCDNQGNLIRSIEKLPPGKKLRAHLEDGSRPLEVIEEESD